MTYDRTMYDKRTQLEDLQDARKGFQRGSLILIIYPMTAFTDKAFIFIFS